MGEWGRRWQGVDGAGRACKRSLRVRPLEAGFRGLFIFRGNVLGPRQGG